MTSQVLGLAEALDIPFLHKRALLRSPWRWLPGPLCIAPLRGLTADSDSLSPPWPRLLISCGRRSALLARDIRRYSQGQTFCVHIQDPQISPRHFDLVVPPRHDGLEGENVLPTRGALHRVTPERLEAAAARFASAYAHLPRPLVAVLLGGSNRSCRFEAPLAAAIGRQLGAMARREAAGLAITASRRTGAGNVQALVAGLDGVAYDLWDGQGDNPYFGLLALADHIIVTGDSASMVSEACATGKPVHVIDIPGYGRRLQRFHDSLRAEGAARVFTGALPHYTYTPVNDTPQVAAVIRQRLGWTD